MTGNTAVRGMAWLVCGAALWLLGWYLRTGLELWPDIVCQAYLGWRVAEGDALYTTLWDSHPPVAVLYASLFHLVLEPSEATARLLVFSTAVLFGAVQAFVAWVAGVRSRLFIVGVGLLATAASVATTANARSEDFVVIFGSLGVFSSVRARNSSSGAWPALAGCSLVIAAFAKPAAIAAGVVSLVLLAGIPQRWRKLRWAFAGATPALFGFLAYFLVGGRYGAAWNQIVVYGRYYFRPLTAALAAHGVRELFSEFGWVYVLIAVPTLLVCGFACRARRSLLTLTLISWPILEGVMSIAQTTHFPYVFFPVYCTLVTLCVFAVGRVVSRRDAEPGDVPVWLLLVFAGGFSLVALGSSYDVMRSVALAGVAATVVTLLMPGHTKTLRSSRAGAVALLCFMSLALAGQAAARRARFFNGYMDKTAEFAQMLARDRAELGDSILWFDVAPTVGYLGALRQAVPEYVLNPLFYGGYATNERWTRVETALDEVKVVLFFEEWSLLKPQPQLASLPAYGASMDKLRANFDDLGEADVLPYGRSSLRVFVRKGEAPELRKSLTAIYGLSLAAQR